MSVAPASDCPILPGPWLTAGAVGIQRPYTRSLITTSPLEVDPSPAYCWATGSVQRLSIPAMKNAHLDHFSPISVTEALCVPRPSFSLQLLPLHRRRRFQASSHCPHQAEITLHLPSGSKGKGREAWPGFIDL